VSRSTSTVHPNDCTAKLKWKLYPDPSSTELCLRKGESSDYEGSS
jgi:hypothetical protein